MSLNVATNILILLATFQAVYSHPYKSNENLQSVWTQQRSNEANYAPDSEKMRSIDDFIVVFKEEATVQDVGDHKELIKTLSNSGHLIHEYDMGSRFRGYAAKMTESEARSIKTHPSVKYVQRNKIFTVSCDHEQRLGQDIWRWGLARISHRNANFLSSLTTSSLMYNYTSTGAGVDVYIVDSGIDTSHPDFGGRAKFGVSFIEEYDEDLRGHGTSVAGVVNSISSGVAKEATTIAVKVCDAWGDCKYSDILAGINWVVKNHDETCGAKSVINLSLHTHETQFGLAYEDAVKAAIAKGIHVVSAAGNQGEDACHAAPNRLDEVITAGGIDMTNNAIYNYGSCVDISAPAKMIKTTWKDGGEKVSDGTSYAAPFVAGVIARILQTENFTPAAMKAKLQEIATKDQIKGIGSRGTPNLILYAECY